MPKREIIHRAGRPLNRRLKRDLSRYFDESDLQRLERLGGRVVISVTAPYKRKAGKSRKPVAINLEFVQNLESIKESQVKLFNRLDGLTIPELRNLASLLGQPIRSSANSTEIRSDIVGFLQAEDIWRRISGADTRPAVARDRRHRVR